MAYQMNCVRPAVSVEDEFNHRVRNWGAADIERIKNRDIDLSTLSDYERSVAECWRDAVEEHSKQVA